MRIKRINYVLRGNYQEQVKYYYIVLVMRILLCKQYEHNITSVCMDITGNYGWMYIMSSQL